jgi:hypothetical protein
MDKSIPILFADDTSIIVKNPNRNEYEKEITVMLQNIREWFKANLLTLNLEKNIFFAIHNKR